MSRITLSVVASLVVGIACGFAMAQAPQGQTLVQRLASAAPAAGPSRDAAAALPADSRAPQAGLRPDDQAETLSEQAWLAAFQSMNLETPDGETVHRLQQALGGSTTLRAAMMSHYRTEQNPAARLALRRMLAATGAADIVALSHQWARSSDSAQRLSGFELLVALPQSEETYALARRSIASERDPSVLAKALVLTRPALLPSPDETQQVLPLILALVDHPADLVRAHSVQLLAEWDRTGELALPVTLRALADKAAVVRQAAVGAVMIGQLHAEKIKPALFRVIENTNEDPNTIAAALQAMERFTLNKTEHATYLSAHSAIVQRFQAPSAR